MTNPVNPLTKLVFLTGASTEPYLQIDYGDLSGHFLAVVAQDADFMKFDLGVYCLFTIQRNLS